MLSETGALLGCWGCGYRGRLRARVDGEEMQDGFVRFEGTLKNQMTI